MDYIGLRRKYYATANGSFEYCSKNKYITGPEMLAQAKAFAVVDAVNTDEVSAWKHRTLNWYNSGKSQHTNPIKYISYEDLDNFTSYAAEKCEEYLQSKGLGK